MIGKILKSSSNKPCSCPTGKICTPCKTKKFIQPQVIVEDPRRLPAPITVTYYKPSPKSLKSTPTTVHYMEKSERWKIRKRPAYESPPKKNTAICRWYKRRKALKELALEHKKEQEILKQRKHDEYERERMKELMKWEEARQRALSLPPPREKKFVISRRPRHSSLPPPREKKRSVCSKEKCAAVKPRAHSKCVSVKKYERRDSISTRFVNYCYRICCQFYCYLTCIIFVVILVVLVF